MRSKRWFPYAVTLGVYGVVALLVWLLFWDSFTHQWHGRTTITRNQRVYFRLNNALAEENDQYRRIVIRDSIEPLIPHDRRLFALLPPGDTASRNHALDLLSRETGRPPRAAVGIAGVSVQFAQHPALKNTFSRAFYLSGSAAGTPYCVAVLPTWHGALEFSMVNVSRRGLRVLGECAFWARYGAPGSAVTHWLAHGGTRFARVPVGLNVTDIDRSSLFGNALFRPSRFRWEASLQGQACLAGRLDECTRAFLYPNQVSDAVASSYGATFYMPRLFYAEAYLLGSLRQQFGDARFERFWTSNEPVEEAFQSAFGVAPGQWIHDWMTRVLNPLRPGARMGFGNVVLSSILILVMIAASAGIGSRRRVQAA